MFEDELGFILEKFRSGEFNHFEATLEIEALVSKCLGFSILTSRLINKLPTKVR